jgi:hypothetical protein
MTTNNVLGMAGTRRGLALTLAVIHHGLSCLSERSIPAKVETVLKTADDFDNWVGTGE